VAAFIDVRLGDLGVVPRVQVRTHYPKVRDAFQRHVVGAVVGTGDRRDRDDQTTREQIEIEVDKSRAP
jgi:hypothetical protein